MGIGPGFGEGGERYSGSADIYESLFRHEGSQTQNKYKEQVVRTVKNRC